VEEGRRNDCQPLQLVLRALIQRRLDGAVVEAVHALFRPRRCGFHALVGIIVGHSGNETTAVSVASCYIWIKEAMEKLSGS
jgi:hypothetical protein